MCCNCLTIVMDEQGAEFPFVRPLVLNKEERKLEPADYWLVHLYQSDEEGAVSMDNIKSLILNFCPICGADIKPKSAKE